VPTANFENSPKHHLPGGEENCLQILLARDSVSRPTWIGAGGEHAGGRIGLEGGAGALGEIRTANVTYYDI
jgi:hypothetical protein